MGEQQARLWLAIVLSMLVWLAYDHYVLAPARDAARQSEQAAETTGEGLPAPVVPENTAPEGDHPDSAAHPAASGGPRAGGSELAEPPSGPEITVETPLYQAVLTPKGARLVAFRLKRYRTNVVKDSPPLDLVDASPGKILPLTLWVGTTTPDSRIEYSTDQTSFVISDGEEASVEFTGRLDDGTEIKKVVRFDGSTYLIGVTLRVDGPASPATASIIVPRIAATGGYSRAGDHAVAIAGGRLVEHSIADIEKEPASATAVEWAGFTGTYFATTALPSDGPATAVFGSATAGPVVRLDVPVSGGEAGFMVLLGPKDRRLLASYGHHLERLVDYGWFWFIAEPLLWLLHRVNDVVHNYGVAIIIVTILLKAVTFPLNQKSMTSMRKMQEIQPHLQRLRDRHKDDPAAMQREMMELYKKHNVNPFSGCLPMLVQIPIFIGLYNGLLRDISLRHAPFIGWINDLSAPDRLYVAGIGIPVLTLLMGASMLLQQVTAPAQGDPTQRRMMMIMPVVFTFMFINFPSGLVLYWLVNNVISIGQQYMALRQTA